LSLPPEEADEHLPHHHHDNAENTAAAADTVKDPVCGMVGAKLWSQTCRGLFANIGGLLRSRLDGKLGEAPMIFMAADAAMRERPIQHDRPALARAFAIGWQPYVRTRRLHREWAGRHVQDLNLAR
jgi:hypothetical protein